jgi:glucose-6-phosphate isomerase
MSALSRLIASDAVSRLRAHDASLWSDDAAIREQIAGSLGWTALASEARFTLGALEALAVDVRNEGLDDVVLLGMGGSSLAALVMARVLARDTRVHILDTTCPTTVRSVLEAIDPARTIHLVSSKSGGTIEPNTLATIFLERATAALGDVAPSRFIAATDPGSSLETRAREGGWRAIVPTPADVGGRYSALTAFGLLPTSLAGADVSQLLATARSMEAACDLPGADNPAFELAAYIADAHAAGRDKLTVVASPALASFGLWVEQLVAESLGKDGLGVVPVTELAEDPSGYGPDRAVVVVRFADDARLAEWAERERSERDVAELVLGGTHDLGAEFVRWEHAIALVGALLGVNPFDQPNVAEAKETTARVLAREIEPPAPQGCDDGVEITFAGALEAESSAEPTVADAVRAVLRTLSPGDYLAVLAYLPDTEEALVPIGKACIALSAGTGFATAFELGPRYLHSTGQLHKGGPNSGAFIMVTTRDAADIAVPGSAWTLRELFRSQAAGDLVTLGAHARRVVRFDLPDARPETIAAFSATLASVVR